MFLTLCSLLTLNWNVFVCLFSSLSIKQTTDGLGWDPLKNWCPRNMWDVIAKVLYHYFLHVLIYKPNLLVKFVCMAFVANALQRTRCSQHSTSWSILIKNLSFTLILFSLQRKPWKMNGAEVHLNSFSHLRYMVWCFDINSCFWVAAVVKFKGKVIATFLAVNTAFSYQKIGSWDTYWVKKMLLL